MSESNKIKTGNHEALWPIWMLGIGIGIVTFIIICSSKIIKVNFSELLIGLLFLIAFLGAFIGLGWHSRRVNKKKLSTANFDLKATIVFFLIMYSFVAFALELSGGWIIFPKSYYLYSALSLAGGLLFGSLVDIGSRKAIGVVKK